MCVPCTTCHVCVVCPVRHMMCPSRPACPSPDGGLYTATRYEFRSIPDIRRSRHPHSLRTEEAPVHWLNGEEDEAGWLQALSLTHPSSGSHAIPRSLSEPGHPTPVCCQGRDGARPGPQVSEEPPNALTLQMLSLCSQCWCGRARPALWVMTTRFITSSRSGQLPRRVPAASGQAAAVTEWPGWPVCARWTGLRLGHGTEPGLLALASDPCPRPSLCRETWEEKRSCRRSGPLS